jgi:hypothetical protein
MADVFNFSFVTACSEKYLSKLQQRKVQGANK